MKTVVCFGDSNTWGYTPETGLRYSYDERWPGVLQGALAGHIRVIEEGLNGRTTSFDEPFRADSNGSRVLPAILETHRPLDLIVIALGVNDLQPIYNVSGFDSARGIEKLIEIVKRSEAGPNETAPEILVITPTRLNSSVEGIMLYFGDATDKFTQAVAEYRTVAENASCHYFDSNAVIVTSEFDGVHIDEHNHKKLGLAIANEVKRIFKI